MAKSAPSSTKKDAKKARHHKVAPVASSVVRGNLIARYAMLVCALTLPIVVGSYYLLIGQNVESAENTRLREMSMLFANQQQNVLNAEIVQIRSRLKSLTATPAIKRIAGYADKDQRKVDAAHRRFEANLLQTFPEAISFNYVPISRLGTAGIRNSERFRNNIELDIIQRTGFAKSSHIEAYRFEKTWLVSFADWAEPSVVLMVTVPVEHFRSILKNTTAKHVQISLNQDFQGKRHVITATKIADPSERMTARPLEVPGWTVEVRLSKTLEAMLKENRFAYWVLCAISMAMILLTGVAIALWFQRMLNKDVEGFAKAELAEFKFDAIARLKANLLAKSRAAKQQKQKQQEAKQAHKPGPPPKPKTEGMVIEELPADSAAQPTKQD